jgi:hypothetical protein
VLAVTGVNSGLIIRAGIIEHSFRRCTGDGPAHL